MFDGRRIYVLDDEFHRRVFMSSRRRIVAAAALFACVLAGGTAPTAGASVVRSIGSGDTVADGARSRSLAVTNSGVRQACRSGPSSRGCGLTDVTREVIAHGIAEYTMVVRVGPGEHDVIRVHRVVREATAWRPQPSAHAVFLVHGAVWGFDPVFAGDVGAARRAPSVAAFLAGHGLDVWGIDLRWVMVPTQTADRSFMAPWGFSTDLADLRLATTIQRAVRSLTGSGSGKTALLGWSRGGMVAYAYASAETQLPARARNVSALVPADTTIKYAPADNAFRRGNCAAYRRDRADLASGTAAVPFGFFRALGRAAKANPNGPSHLISGVTNLQAALLVGESTPGFFNPWFHFFAARNDDAGLPTRLHYTPTPRYLGLLTRAAAWESLRQFVDTEALLCDRTDVSFDDHLAAVRIPVLYLAGAGGFGSTGVYSTTLVGSADVRTLIVRLQPRGQEKVDFGHVDLWEASNAPTRVWTPLMHWLRSH